MNCWLLPEKSAMGQQAGDNQALKYCPLSAQSVRTPSTLTSALRAALGSIWERHGLPGILCCVLFSLTRSCSTKTAQKAAFRSRHLFLAARLTACEQDLHLTQ